VKKKRMKGKWVFVADSPEEQLEAEQDKVFSMLTIGLQMGAKGENRFIAGCRAIEQFHDYFPGDNEIPKEGAWVLVTESPSTQYTVPPLSAWFAEPWPFDKKSSSSMPHRVRIVTPKGDLGLFPREYSIIKDVAKYFEFIGKDMAIKFFGSTQGVPEMPLFYLRSRGIPKKAAISLLLGQIKSHGVCWLESSKKVCGQFGKDWPHESRLATH
jgi:hypothetical protein